MMNSIARRMHRISSDLPSWAVSIAVHVLILAILATLTLAVRDQVLDDGVGIELSDTAEPASPGSAPSNAEAVPNVTPTAPPPMPLPVTPATISPPQPPLPDLLDTESLSADALLYDLSGSPGAVAGRGLNPLLEGTSTGFQDLVGRMRGRGLDVVFVLDSTASMDDKIQQAKRRIHDVINVINAIVGGEDDQQRNVRFGIVDYKDYGDLYGNDNPTRSLPLTFDVGRVVDHLGRITSSGGGADAPEPIDRALEAATDSNRMGWKRRRHSVIVLVGDAGVHASGRDRAMNQARLFAKYYDGSINTLYIADPGMTRMHTDYAAIAKAGNGEAYMFNDADVFWRGLIVSVFGPQFEKDVQHIVERYAR